MHCLCVDLFKCLYSHSIQIWRSEKIVDSRGMAAYASAKWVRSMTFAKYSHLNEVRFSIRKNREWNYLLIIIILHSIVDGVGCTVRAAIFERNDFICGNCFGLNRFIIDIKFDMMKKNNSPTLSTEAPKKKPTTPPMFAAIECRSDSLLNAYIEHSHLNDWTDLRNWLIEMPYPCDNVWCPVAWRTHLYRPVTYCRFACPNGINRWKIWFSNFNSKFTSSRFPWPNHGTRRVDIRADIDSRGHIQFRKNTVTPLVVSHNWEWLKRGGFNNKLISKCVVQFLLSKWLRHRRPRTVHGG